MAIDLRVFRPDALGPCRVEQGEQVLSRVDVRVGGQAGATSTTSPGGRDDRAEAAVAIELVGKGERCSPEQDRVPAGIAVVARDDDRMRRGRADVEERTDHVGIHGRLVAEHDDAAPASGPTASRPMRDRVGQPAPGCGFRARRSDRHSIEASMKIASSPSTTTTSSMPAAATRSRTCCRTGRPSRDARSLPPPNREAAPAARTTAVVVAGWLRAVVAVEQARCPVGPTPGRGRGAHPPAGHDVDRGVALAGRVLDERDESTGHESSGADRRPAAGDLGDLDDATGRRDLDPPTGARRDDIERLHRATGVDRRPRPDRPSCRGPAASARSFNGTPLPP